jgi:anti-sigma B factor antagonist
MASLRFELDFRIRTARVAGGAFLVSLVGELDLHTTPQLQTVLAGLDGHEAEQLVIDLTDVTFVDSAALGALVAEARARSAAGRELILVCDNRATLRVLEVTGVRRLFRIEASLRDAVAAVSGQVG